MIVESHHIVLPGVAGALEAVHADAVRAQPLGRERVLDLRRLAHSPMCVNELSSGGNSLHARA